MISYSLDGSLPHLPFALVTPFDFVTKSEYSVSRGGWDTCAAGGQIFILRTLIWGIRGVKGKAHCAISLVSHSCAKDAQEWGTPALVVHASKA
jgi:hypothetical protein